MKPSNPRRRSGFTLIEVLLVLVILVVLSSIAVMAYGPAQKRANINTAKTQMNVLEQALERYKMELHEYPATLECLWVNVNGTPEWGGPYLNKELPADPWGNGYVYESDGTNFRLSSRGPSPDEPVQGPASNN